MKDVIIACDFPGKEATLAFLKELDVPGAYVKVGMELFYAEGPDVVSAIRELGYRIFLDLKLHDIPHTVSGAVRSLSRLDVDMINVHSAGGVAMMKAAREALMAKEGKRPLLIAVTQLTSTSAEALAEELLVQGDMGQVVLHYARNAQLAGLDGAVCSPREAGLIKAALGRDFLAVTPGIRPAGGSRDDQVRVATPAGAAAAGSDYIVVGRPITAAPFPGEAYRLIRDAFLGGGQ